MSEPMTMTGALLAMDQERPDLWLERWSEPIRRLLFDADELGERAAVAFYVGSVKWIIYSDIRERALSIGRAWTEKMTMNIHHTL